MLRKLCATLCCARANSVDDVRHAHIHSVLTASRDEVQPEAEKSSTAGLSPLTSIEKEKDEDEAHHAQIHHVHSPGRNEVELGVKTNSTTKLSPSTSSDTKLKDLWKEAFNKLDPESRRWLSTGDPLSTTDAIDQVIKETKEKYTEYKNKELAIRKRDGGQMKVREIAGNMLTWALRAQDAVKAVVAFDPSGHASSAWTVVSLGLTMINNDIERRDAIFQASEYLAGKLAYFSIMDTEYRYQGIKDFKGLEDALVGAYTAILEYSAEVKKRYHESTAARIGNALISLTEQPLQQLKESVESWCAEVVRWADLTDHSHKEAQARSILIAIDNVTEESRKSQAMIFDAEEERILDWLSAVSYSDIHNSAQKCRTSKTGDWFIESEIYHRWKNSSGKMLWLHGVAGCGKTVLCSTIIEDIARICWDDQAKRYAYWYFKFDNFETHKVEHMVRSAIRQLCPIPLPEVIRKAWKTHSRKGSQPNLQDLLEILHKVLAGLDGEAFIILDAMDECPESPDHSERSSLLSLLIHLLEQHTNVHILATGRPEADIRTRLDGHMALDLEKKLEPDVERFVRLRVRNGNLAGFGEKITTMIIHELLQISERRFRWADLQLKRLEDCNTHAQIEETLKTIPPTLESTYRDVLDRIKPKDQDIARSILIWLSFSVRPLTMREAASAVGLLAPDRVVDICTTSFVTVGKPDSSGESDGVEEYIRLAHFSVKEFLVPQGTACAKHWCQFSPSAGHLLIAEQTLSRLLDQTERVTGATAVEQPLLAYAAESWPEHVQELTSMAHEYTGLKGKIDQLFCHSTVYHNWQCLLGLDDDESLPPIGAASKFGFQHAVEALLAQGADPLEKIARSYYFTYPFLVAAEEAQLDILDCLLQNVSVTANMAERILGVVKHEGSGVGSLERVMDRLLDAKAMFDESAEQDNIIDERMVMAAAENQASGLELMTIFLGRFEKERRVSVPITDDIVVCVIKNWHAGRDMLALLFNKRNADVRVTSEIVDALTHPLHARVEVLELFVRERAADFLVDEVSMEGLAAKGSQKSMELVMEAHAEDIRITEDLVVAAASNWYGAGALRALLAKRPPGFAITEQMLDTALKNLHAGLEVMEALLDACGPDFPVGENIMQEAVSTTWGYGLDIVKLFLRRQQAGFVISEAVLARAAGNTVPTIGRQMLELLINNGGSGITITEDVLLEAAANGNSPAMAYLLELEGQTKERLLPITEEVFSNVVRRHDAECLETVLRRRPEIRVPEEAFVSACHSQKKLSLLLEQPYDILPIKDMLEAIASNQDIDGEPLTLLLDRQLVEVDEQLVETVARNSFALKILYSRNPNFPITQQAMVRAAEDPAARRFLLDTRIDDVRISEELMIPLLTGDDPLPDVQRILAHFGPKVPITENVLAAAARAGHYYGLSIFQLLLPEWNPAISISEKVLTIAAFWSFPAFQWLLLERGCAEQLTDEVLVAAAGNGYNELQWLIREQLINLQQTWKAIWRFDHDYGFRLGELRKDAAENILSYTLAVDMSENMFEGASIVRDKDGTCAFDGLVRILLTCGFVNLASERLMEMVLERASKEVVNEFLEKASEISVTETHIQALGRNPMLSEKQREELTPLLAGRMHVE
ncbi:uncharacterized protein BO80DRAFT_468932 [Aspergillus ibericus CBS 121593]|uniref:NACHT domain-containing protein n=1 Tax=Aspergillus ibericus CBS 121593 TaxID=1448316 RepID=A0A395GL85_9EURO|nr:hypothetical protein BO80DRAFT_468932 [Aspergillus ibericus CBS 121593]RAK96066.1 hypothetical protein BO80DRAFT_468932 [Aspergillus ibericus CBS 121593]